MAGDELEDGLAYDVDFSGDEAPESKEKLVLESEDELINESDGEEVAVEYKSEQKAGKKRKAGDSKLKEKKKLKMEMDLEQKKSISTESSTEVIADYINKIVAQKNKKLSSLELADLYISKNDIRSTSELEGTRTLDGLAKFIDSRFSNMLPTAKKSKKLKKNKKAEKAEDTIDEKKYIAIVSMSALRACDVFRATKDLGGSSLKLINKNKLDVDIGILQKSSSRVLCCTAGRLRKVYQNEAEVLKKEEVKIIILDNSYLDQKGQNIWDIPETIHVLRELTKSGAKIYLY